jgi:hypothetical protein
VQDKIEQSGIERALGIKGPPTAATRVGDQDVDASPLFGNLRDHGVHRGPISHVQFNPESGAIRSDTITIVVVITTV